MKNNYALVEKEQKYLEWMNDTFVSATIQSLELLE